MSAHVVGNGRKTPISAGQRRALAWVAEHGTLPPVAPATWKSLITRGLIELEISGAVATTAFGDACLREKA